MSIKDLEEMRRIKGGDVGWSGHIFFLQVFGMCEEISGDFLHYDGYKI
jgi:hypothetical protein